MRQVASDKYTIAWFKLAECIARGEREKALGVYRLLSHSLEDPAFALQLEGDILWAFNDSSGAIARYRDAAQLYHKSSNYRHAAGLYEQLALLVPHNIQILTALVTIYKSLALIPSMMHHGLALSTLFIAQKRYDDLLNLLISLEEIVGLSALSAEYTKGCINIIEYAPELVDHGSHFLRKAIQSLLQANNYDQLTLLVSTVHALHSSYHQDALSYIQELSKEPTL